MASYWKFHNNNEFQDRIKHEMQTAAIAVMAEAADTASHAERVVYAKSILDGSASVKEFCIGIMTNADVKAAVTSVGDPYAVDLVYVTASMFNAFAGVSL